MIVQLSHSIDHLLKFLLFAYKCHCDHYLPAESRIAEMKSLQVKAQCVLWYQRTKSSVEVQHKFRNEHQRDPPAVETIQDQSSQRLGEFKTKWTSRPRVSDASVVAVHNAFQCSPKELLHRASVELWLLWSTVHKVLHKRLCLHSYKVHFVQELTPNDIPT